MAWQNLNASISSSRQVRKPPGRFSRPSLNGFASRKPVRFPYFSNWPTALVQLFAFAGVSLMMSCMRSIKGRVSSPASVAKIRSKTPLRLQRMRRL